MRLAGTAAHAGRLSIELAAVDPETGSRAEELLGETVELEPGAFERGLRLPPSRGRPLELCLRWSCTQAEAELRFRTLELIEDEPAPRPPIVLVAIDTLAAGHLSIHGYPRDTTPNLARLAEEAIVFENCVTNAPWTVPSFMSLMSGLYPEAHRLEPEDPKPKLWERWFLSPNRWTLAEALQAAGYETAAFVDSLWITERFGLAQGFALFDSSAARLAKEDPEGGIRHVTRAGHSWMSSLAPDTPFFLFLHAFDVHAPYAPPPPFRGRFRGDELYALDATAPAVPTAGMLDGYGTVHDHVVSQEYAGEEIPARVPIARIIAAYDEGIAMVDDCLGGFLDDLREEGVLDRAILVVLADHGEAMAEKDFFFGHGVLDPSVLHVPLLIRLPHGRGGGRRVSATVQLVDLYPTLLALIGLEGRALHGRSLLPLLRGESLPDAPTYSSGGIMRQSCMIRGGWKLVEKRPGLDSSRALLLSLPALPQLWSEEILPWALERDELRSIAVPLSRIDLTPSFSRIRREGLTHELYDELLHDPVMRGMLLLARRFLTEPRYELYHLPDDPAELHDLAADRPEVLATLEELLRREEDRADSARAHARAPQSSVELSGEELSRLSELGYVESDDH